MSTPVATVTDIAAAITALAARSLLTPPDSPRRPDPQPEPDLPAAYRALLNATDGIVREVAALHGPHPWKRGDGSVAWWECRGCEASGYDWKYPDWPCGTIELIASQVRVSLREDDYTVEAG